MKRIDEVTHTDEKVGMSFDELEASTRRFLEASKERIEKAEEAKRLASASKEERKSDAVTISWDELTSTEEEIHTPPEAPRYASNFYTVKGDAPTGYDPSLSTSNVSPSFSFLNAGSGRISGKRKTLEEAKLSFEERVRKNREEEQAKAQNQPDPFKGALAKEDGPILSVVLTVRVNSIVGWIDYQAPSLRKLMLSRRPFNASNGVVIAADSQPSVRGSTIYLLGRDKELDKLLMHWNMNSQEDASQLLSELLDGLKEFCSVLRGEDFEKEELATKFTKGITHSF